MAKITYGGDSNYLEWALRPDGTVEIIDIAVMTERRKGIGKKLIETLFREQWVHRAPTVWAITRADNLIAQQFYEKLGFEVTGVLRRFYSRDASTVDAIMYGRSPKGPV